MRPLVKILSMQRVANHGSFLQSFALKQLLEQKGAQVRFLDIRPGMDNRAFALKPPDEFPNRKSLKHIPRRLFVKWKTHQQKRLFRLQAARELGLEDSPMEDDRCDLALIGSDEVFACASPSAWGLSAQLFGDIPGASHVASYAASCGQTTLSHVPDAQRQIIAQSLRQLEAISVRDQNSAAFVKELLPEAEVAEHLDPALIYDLSAHVRPCPIKQDFLLLYSYTNRIHRREEIEAIRHYARQQGLEIVCAGCFQHWCRRNIPLSSLELLGYVQAARCVVTDSFHGAVLSVAFRKPFAVAVRDSNRNKLTDLLERLALRERRLEDWTRLSDLLETPMDYRKTEEILATERQRADRWLDSLLELARSKPAMFRRGKHCSGCGACAALCPMKAITMTEDSIGFPYPTVDSQKCTDCGLCQQACPFRKAPEQPACCDVYAAVLNDPETLRQSASGGAFMALAEEILQAGGVVFGCELSYENGIQVKHVPIDRPEQLHRLQGSKYVQSDMGNIYHEVKEAAASGKPLLFSGTPCQVAGLKGYFQGRLPDNLYTVDLVCHGVPSRKLFRDYIKTLETQYGGTIVDFRFRDKSRGWGLLGRVDCVNADGLHSHLIEPQLSSYYRFFLESELYRDSCYSCPYAGPNRPGDLSIGDYWGVEQEHPQLDAQGGVSCLLVNSDKGRKLLARCGKRLTLQPSTLEKAARHNRQLNEPSSHTSLRRELLSAYEAEGYAAVERLFRKRLSWRDHARKIRSFLR